MALAGRGQRRDGGRKLLIAGMIITILVVLIDASLKSRTPSTGPKLAAAAWVDRVLPLIEASSEQGSTVQQIRSLTASDVDRDQIVSEMADTTKAAQTTADQLSALRPPSELAGAAGLLQACMQERALGVAQMSSALSAAFEGPSSENGSAQVADVTAAGQDFQLADQAYHLFAQRLPVTGVHPPASTWVIHPANYQTASVQTYLTTLVSAAAGKLLDQITITQVSLTPTPLATNGGILVLTPTSTVDFSVVVANTGTLTENDFSILVSIDPSQGNAVLKGTVASLAPGAAYNYQYGPLNPKPGAITNLTVMIQPGAGSGLQQTTKTIQFETSTGNGPPATNPLTSGGGTSGSGTSGSSGSGSGSSGSGSSGSGSSGSGSSGSGSSGSGTSTATTGSGTG
jgi:hypothetical protein